MRKIPRYSSAAFKSTSWELKRQSSEKFLCVAGVGLVHTLGGPGRHEDFSPRLYFTVPLRCILGGPQPTLGVDSEGSAVFRDTVFEAFRRLAPFSLPPDHFASHDDGKKKKSTQKKSTQNKVRRRRSRRCNYWPIIYLKTTARTVLPIYSGARDPSSER